MTTSKAVPVGKAVLKDGILWIDGEVVVCTDYRDFYQLALQCSAHIGTILELCFGDKKLVLARTKVGETYNDRRLVNGRMTAAEQFNHTLLTYTGKTEQSCIIIGWSLLAAAAWETLLPDEQELVDITRVHYLCQTAWRSAHSTPEQWAAYQIEALAYFDKLQARIRTGKFVPWQPEYLYDEPIEKPTPPDLDAKISLLALRLPIHPKMAHLCLADYIRWSIYSDILISVENGKAYLSIGGHLIEIASSEFSGLPKHKEGSKDSIVAVCSAARIFRFRASHSRDYISLRLLPTEAPALG